MSTRSNDILGLEKPMQVLEPYLSLLVFVIKPVITNSNKYTSNKRTFVHA